jgi:hypothetical protein
VSVSRRDVHSDVALQFATAVDQDYLVNRRWKLESPLLQEK